MASAGKLSVERLTGGEETRHGQNRVLGRCRRHHIAIIALVCSIVIVTSVLYFPHRQGEAVNTGARQHAPVIPKRDRTHLPKAVLVNAGRLDFDKGLNLSEMEAIVNLTRFESDAGPGEILRRVQGQEIVITKEIPVPGDVISQFPDSVRVIQEAGTGFNNIDLAAAKAKGITVLNCPDYSSEAVAQLVITFILNFSASLAQQIRMVWSGNRKNFLNHLQVPHFELRGKTLGLIGGSGNIGSKVATLAEALGMTVIITSRSTKSKKNIVSLDELLERSDFVSLHCPLTDATRGIINSRTLKLMKSTAFLINTGRGPLIRESELIDALRENRIAGAALDVQEEEPPRKSSPLYRLDNVILTPHIGWKRLETRQRLMDIVTANLDAYSQNKLVNVVPYI